jgi:hypothetical protein
LDTEKLSSTACQFERALREKVVGQDQAVEALVDLYQMFCEIRKNGLWRAGTLVNLPRKRWREHRSEK